MQNVFRDGEGRAVFPGVEKLNAAKAPVRSLWYQCIWACLLVLSGTFDQLTDMIIFAVFIYYGATTLGVFILRKKMPDAPRPYKVWGYPVVPVIVILFCIILFVNTIIERPREAAFGLILMLTGVPLYYWFTKREENLIVWSLRFVVSYSCSRVIKSRRFCSSKVFYTVVI
ncbi:MAG: amino acid permease [Bacteroidota bacterium]